MAVRGHEPPEDDQGAVADLLVERHDELESRTDADEATSVPVASKTRIPAGTPITVSSKVKVTCSGAVSSTAPWAGSDPTSVACAAAGDAGHDEQQGAQAGEQQPGCRAGAGHADSWARWAVQRSVTVLTQPADGTVVKDVNSHYRRSGH